MSDDDRTSITHPHPCALSYHCLCGRYVLPSDLHLDLVGCDGNRTLITTHGHDITAALLRPTTPSVATAAVASARVYHGDVHDLAHHPALAHAPFDGMVTDPPYSLKATVGTDMCTCLHDHGFSHA